MPFRAVVRVLCLVTAAIACDAAGDSPTSPSGGLAAPAAAARRWPRAPAAR
jgi:hypothetical protein